MPSTIRSFLALCALAAPIGVAAPQSADTTRAAPRGSLDELVARATTVNPTIVAAAARQRAAQARVRASGLLPDPMFMVGIQNLPIVKEKAVGHAAPREDPMTMRMIGIGQTLPYPGKLSLEHRIAEREAVSAAVMLDAARLDIRRDVQQAYYELAFLDHAFDIAERNQRVLVSLISLTEGRYSVGAAGQQDVLKAQVEAARLAETAVSLAEERRAVAARLNALLDLPADSGFPPVDIPARVIRAAAGDAAREIRFVSAALGARVADSPLPPLPELQEMAVRSNPEIRSSDAMIAAQAARVELARKGALPDFDLSLQYGQRNGYGDMISASVSIPLPLQRRRKQGQLVTGAAAELAALQSERHARANSTRAEVARLVSELERSRAQLALYVKAILPQSRAALTSATASYQVGRVEFLAVVSDQATLFSYETEYFRVLADFGKKLAELERLVGQEVIR